MAPVVGSDRDVVGVLLSRVRHLARFLAQSVQSALRQASRPGSAVGGLVTGLIRARRALVADECHVPSAAHRGIPLGETPPRSRRMNDDYCRDRERAATLEGARVGDGRCLTFRPDRCARAAVAPQWC